MSLIHHIRKSPPKLCLPFLFGLLFVLAMGAGLRAWAADGKAPTNVIMILSDDLGWADLFCGGRSKFHETPHFDAVAARSVSFHRAYAASPRSDGMV